MKYYSTWSDILKNKQISYIQDPIIEMELDKYDFGKIYKEIVCDLHGTDGYYESYIDYYFTVNPLKSFVLSFKSSRV